MKNIHMHASRAAIKKDIEDFYNRDVRDYHHRNYIASGPYSPLKYRQFYIEGMIDRRNLPQEALILDVGCGPGELILNLLKKSYNVWGVDISQGMIRTAYETMRTNGFPDWNHGSVGDIETLDFDNGRFDVVVASGVIEYQKDDDGALREMNRILKLDGFLILNVTNKYSYVNSLNGIYTRLKRNRATRGVLDFLKDRILRRGRIRDRRIHPDRRIHSPAAFDRQLRQFGFEKVEHNFFHFGLLPKPLDGFLPFNDAAARRMETLLTKGSVGIVGGGYIVLARKIADIRR